VVNAIPSDAGIEATFAVVDLAGFTAMTEVHGDTEAVAARGVGAIITHVGSVELRNVSESVDVYYVRVGEGTDAVAIDPVCQMRVPTTGDAAVALDWSGRRYHFCGLPCVARFAANPDRYRDRTSKWHHVEPGLPPSQSP
jgi:YHS domain-containing protein